MTHSSILLLASAGVLAFAPSPTAAASPDAHALASRMLRNRPSTQASRPGPAKEPIAGVAAANHAAVLEPDANYYLGSAQVYPWSEGALFRLFAAPEQISDIALQPGETLVSVAAGDTTRWMIGDTASGSGSTLRTHVLVKPVAPGLRTNIVIATNRRIYHVEAVSTSRTAMAAISWSYPGDGLTALRPVVAAVPDSYPGDGLTALRPVVAAVPDPVIAATVAVEALNFDYRIEGDKASWRPVRVFDDGHQTFIEFPADLGDGEAPPLFVSGVDGNSALVNYRVKGHYYVVDRLFAAAELRLGGKHQQVVRITRDNGRRSGRRS